MGKYVYSKNYNKIFLTERFKKVDGWYKEINEPHFGGSWDDIDFEVKDSIEFDRFEDLIEVGDLVTYMSINGLSLCEETRLVARIKDNHIWCTAMELREGAIIEIYKHIGKDFIRIAHKEREGWVIN